LGIDAGTPVAIFCGSEWKRKGLDIAIRAVSLTSQYHLIVLGSGDQVTYTTLAEECGVKERVHFVGRRPDPEMYYPAADVFVLPSHYEGMSLAALEALACGLPLIVTETPGASETVHDGGNGWRLSRDPQEYAARLCELHDDATLAERMGISSRRLAETLSWSKAVARYQDIYASSADSGS
jgi:UDP-glucose:(heptosyl)LPS alpha-1,3-glucosyltransferase